MTVLPWLKKRIPDGINPSVFRFGGTMTASLIVSVDCLTSPIEGAFIAAMIDQAGPGDYVEIGCAYGGTAILAALTKRIFDIPGKVVTIDSFEGVTCSHEHAMGNIIGHGLEHYIEVVQANSCPWPLPENRKFVVGYVDGNHRGNAPYNDMMSISKCVEKYILVHDYDMRSTDVVRGVNRFSDEHPEWVPIAGHKRIIAFGKRAI